METNILEKLAVSLNNTAKILIELAEISQSAATENSDYEEIKEAKNETEVSLEQIRAVLAEKSRMGMTSAIRNLLLEYGADKLSAVDSKFYSAILEKAEEMNNGT